jgi:hypothetical protein
LKPVALGLFNDPHCLVTREVLMLLVEVIDLVGLAKRYPVTVLTADLALIV